MATAGANCRSGSPVPPAGCIVASLIVMVAIAAAISIYNMDVLNTYRTSGSTSVKLLADYEKAYLKYEKVKQPSLTDIRMTVDIDPAVRRMAASGTYRFVNDTGAPVPMLHVRLPDQKTRLVSVTVPGARLAMDDSKQKYRIYRFDRPLAPGATGTLSFRTEREQRGLRANNEDTRLVANGTFLDNSEFAPEIGMSRNGLLTDRAKRRKYGLPAELRPAKLEDVSAQDRNYVGNIDWVHSDITVSTSAGQTPIAPGRKLSDIVTNGRRTARYVSSAPILAFFSIQSAAYAEKSAMADGVKLTVYYDPKHGYNVNRMLAAMNSSLGYYRANFGPYQFDYTRIIEFPGYDDVRAGLCGHDPLF
jgi:ABC-2 type transport system permease protein